MEIWLQLLLKYGASTAYELWKEWKDKNEPTDEMWNKAIALTEKKGADYDAEALVRAGLSSTPPKSVVAP